MRGDRRGSLPEVLISSWMWHLTRWDGLFLGTYLVTHLGGRPIANQLAGFAMFSPMVLGAYVASRTRRDVDPRRLVLFTELALLPISAVMIAVVSTGADRIWMVYPFELLYGFGGMVNMTAQRELLFRIAGPKRSHRALSAEMAGLASATMLGPLIGGVTIGVFGLGAAFAVPTVLLACSAALLWRATRGMPADAPTTGGPGSAPAAAPVRTGWQLLRRSPALRVILAVTVICNLCYFAFLPLVPVIAKGLGAGATMAGVLGSAAGTVQLVTAAALVVRPARRPGAAYALAVALCLCCLGLLSYAPAVSVALLVLGVAGVGQAFFGTMQATLSVGAVDPQERTAALGLLSTTIGIALPSGMVILGVSASLLGTRPAMLVSALVGLAALTTTLLGNRQLMRPPTEARPATATPETVSPDA
ncbi:MFS transporter [Streptomyces sp. NPDC050287]|uniref:MFS transporter n=1 Tax=Streptomyces sp. NPDC050287 TaxID=3365608 RepID=UPI00379C8A2F